MSPTPQLTLTLRHWLSYDIATFTMPVLDMLALADMQQDDKNALFTVWQYDFSFTALYHRIYRDAIDINLYN